LTDPISLSVLAPLKLILCDRLQKNAAFFEVSLVDNSEQTT
jgi:hypothetical protein